MPGKRKNKSSKSRKSNKNVYKSTNDPKSAEHDEQNPEESDSDVEGSLATADLEPAQPPAKPKTKPEVPPRPPPKPKPEPKQPAGDLEPKPEVAPAQGKKPEPERTPAEAEPNPGVPPKKKKKKKKKPKPKPKPEELTAPVVTSSKASQSSEHHEVDPDETESEPEPSTENPKPSQSSETKSKPEPSTEKPEPRPKDHGIPPDETEWNFDDSSSSSESMSDEPDPPEKEKEKPPESDDRPWYPGCMELLPTPIGPPWRMVVSPHPAHELPDRNFQIQFNLSSDPEKEYFWEAEADKHHDFSNVAEKGKDAGDKESKQPESKQPESKQPESKQPESKQPESKQPESKQPESKQPEFKQQESKQQDEDMAKKLAALESMFKKLNIDDEGPKPEPEPAPQPKDEGDWDDRWVAWLTIATDNVDDLMRHGFDFSPANIRDKGESYCWYPYWPGTDDREEGEGMDVRFWRVSDTEDPRTSRWGGLLAVYTTDEAFLYRIKPEKVDFGAGDVVAAHVWDMCEGVLNPLLYS
ncbi:hypothetical protein GE09DRAFT_501460 [Coniochaeta sp. 2T2.1]|nr:hypothetical protein GE09DRAFT_501460 [Coniochaeta sp. 2T2.1]